jgi:hypothetical protein
LTLLDDVRALAESLTTGEITLDRTALGAFSSDDLHSDPAALESILDADLDAERMAGALRAARPADVHTAAVDIVGRTVSDIVPGGDVLDWTCTDDEVTFSIAEVSGVGLPAAMLAAGVRGALGARRTLAASAAVAGVERQVASELDDARAVASLFHAKFAPRTGRLEFVDAGHGLVVKIGVDGAATLLRSSSLPMGVGRVAVRPTTQIMLRRGEALVVVSTGLLALLDGSIDAMDEVAAWYREAGDLEVFVEALVASARAARGQRDASVFAIARH